MRRSLGVARARRAVAPRSRPRTGSISSAPPERPGGWLSHRRRQDPPLQRAPPARAAARGSGPAPPRWQRAHRPRAPPRPPPPRVRRQPRRASGPVWRRRRKPWARKARRAARSPARRASWCLNASGSATFAWASARAWIAAPRGLYAARRLLQNAGAPPGATQSQPCQLQAAGVVSCGAAKRALPVDVLRLRVDLGGGGEQANLCRELGRHV